MSRAITSKILVITILLTSVKLNAQQWLGRTTGNYSGTYGLYNNASSIADSKYKYYFNFWGRGDNFYNNNMLYNAPIKLNQWANGTYDINQKRLDGKPDFQKDWLIESLNGKTKQFSFNQDIWGPSFMFPLSHQVSMSINTRQRSSLQIFGISEPMARFAYHGLDSSSGIYKGNNGLNRNTGYSNGKFGVNAQSFQELSFSLAGVLAKNTKNQLTGGLTVKFIRGLGAAYVRGTGFDMAVTGNNSAQIQNANIQYAYTDDKSVVAPFNKPYGLFTLQSKGGGAGIDLGLTYTHRSRAGKYANNKYCNDNNNRSDYDFKLAAAFNDLGGIHFNQGAVKYDYSNTSAVNVNTSTNILNGFNQPKQNAFDTIGQKVFGQLGAAKTRGFTTSLPAAFNMQMDFRMSEHLYTAIYLNQSLKSINSTGMRSTSMLSVIPRFESRGFEFSMPLTLSENYKNFYVGAYARFGPVFVGSDNLGGLLNVAGNTEFRGADIYGGVSFGIGYCHKWWSEDKVEPTRIDTVTQRDSIIKKDSIKTEKRDTINILKRDTIKIKVHDTIIINKKGEAINKVIHDTLYIEKTIKSKSDYDKELELKKQEEILNARQRELDRKERDLQDKLKGTYNESEILKNCKTQTTVLTAENTTLKTKVNTQDDEITRLKLLVEELNRNKSKNDAEILALKSCKGIIKYNEAGRALTPCELYEEELYRRKNLETANIAKDAEIEKLDKNVAELEAQITALKKIIASKTDVEVMKGTDAEKLQKAQKQIDSLNIKLITLQAEINNCKKNISVNQAEILKAQADKAKAENEAKLASKKADSLQSKLIYINADLDNCKKNSSQNDAEINKAKNDKAKAENDARLALKKADSLQSRLIYVVADLENCKKGNGSQNDAEIVKAKADKAKAENEAKLALKKADSLQIKLIYLNADLENCKKGSGSQNDAEIVKLKTEKANAENLAKLAVKKADSLQIKLVSINEDLDNCKKNSNNSNNEATLVKLKKCEDDYALYKAELDAANKTNLTLNAKIYKRDATIDSLITELSNCKNNNNSNENAELLKKCNQAKNDLNTETLTLKNRVNAANKSLDSANIVAANLKKDKVTLEAQVADLNEKVKISNNCDDLKKQIDEKNATITDLKSQNTALQTKVNNLTSQLNELKTEYNFINVQNQKCSKKLDSCMRGLLNNPGNGDGGNGGSKGGSIDDNNSGSIDNPNSESSDSTILEGKNENSSNDDVYSSSPTKERKYGLLNLGVEIAKIIIKSASSNGNTTSSPAPVPGNPKETPSTNTGNNTGTNTGNTGNGRNTETKVERNTSSGTSGSTRRR